MRSFSPCGAASTGLVLLARGIARFDCALVLSVFLAACGSDAERRYADLTTASIELAVGGYRLRYLHPPWKRQDDDPLATGARTAVTVGGTSREIVAASAVVLEISKQSSASDPEHLSIPKYRLESVLLRCTEGELQAGQSCAETLASQDQEANGAEGDFELFGTEPRAGQNDFDQALYEFMGQLAADQRYRRVAFFATDERTLAARLLIEGNPDLAEQEITHLVQAFELTPPQEAP